MDRIIEEYAVLLAVIIIASIVAGVIVKMKIDTKKGMNSEEKRQVKDILRKNIPESEEYIPVYAYMRKDTARTARSWFYAIGLTVDKMYVIPLIIGEKEIGYGKPGIIQKDNLGKVDPGKPGGSMHIIHFFDKNNKIVFEMYLEECNTKLDKSYPVNITQKEEVRAFMDRITQWNT